MWPISQRQYNLLCRVSAERAQTVTQRHLQFAYLRWAGFSCSLLPAEQPVYRDRCPSCGGHGCATCAYWENTR